VGFNDVDVVLTLPASPEFGDVARLAVGELGRRGGFTRTELEDLEAAVVYTLRLLERNDTERVRFTFGFTSEEIVVEAELTTSAGRAALAGETDARFRATIAELVDDFGIDHDLGRVRFRKLRS
jgi:hypothetical protein